MYSENEFEVSLLPYLLLFSSLMFSILPLVNEGVEINNTITDKEIHFLICSCNIQFD